MGELIPVRVTRYRCPHCARSASSKQRCREHIRRCWRNPDAKGCKTCKHFDNTYEDYGEDYGEDCAVGVDLSGRPECQRCHGVGYDPAATWDSGEKCRECKGNGAAVKPGPIVGCDKWESAEHEVSR